jgi:hypothetical protein
MKKKKVIISSVILLLIVSFLSYNNFIDSSKHDVKSKSFKLPKFERKKAREDYFFKILRDPATNSIPQNIRERELQFARTLDNANRLNKSASAVFDWAEAGPVDVGGRTRGLAVDRRNTNIVLAGGVNGGIWKSTDKGNTWVLKSDPALDLSVTYIAQDYNNEDVWYYTSGEFTQSANDIGFTAKVFGSGLYKSTNNGETWFNIQSAGSTVDSDTPFDFMSKVIVSPTTGSVFISSNLYGIYRSTDGGNNFDQVLGADANQVDFYEIDIASNGNILVTASTNKFDVNEPISGGIYYSTDDGDNFTDITPDGYDDFAEVKRGVIAFAPSNSSVAYAWIDGADLEFNETTKFFKLNLNNNTAEDRTNNLPNFPEPAGQINTQGSYNMILAVKPNDENFVILGATNLYRSFDGFATLADTELKNWIGGYTIENNFGSYENHHSDQHAIFFEPGNPNAVWSGHDGGLSYTTNILEQNTTISWIDKNRGYNVTQFYKVDILDEEGTIGIGGGTQDNGSPVFERVNNVSANSDDLSTGDGAFIFVGSNFVLASAQEGNLIRNDTDGNQSYVKPLNATDVQFIHPFRVDPNDNDIVYFPEGRQLWRNNQISTINNQDNFDGTTEGWNLLGDVDASSGAEHIITSLAVSVTPAHILYLGLSSSESTPKIVKLENANNAVSGFVSINLPNASIGSYVHDIAVNPNDADEFIVVVSNYNVNSIFHTIDGGANFTVADGNLLGDNNNPGPSVRAAEIIPLENTTVYLAATSIGLYSTTQLNGNSTSWFKEASGLIGSTVSNDIAKSLNSNLVAVGTHGRGIFIGEPNSSVNVDEDKLTASSFELFNNYPNPFNPTTIIEYSVVSNEFVSLKVYDMLGKEIATLVNEQKSAGKYKVNFDASSLASGVYIYKLTAGNFSDSKKMVLTK